ncbi:hypothetical protein [Aquibacillus saliphilus]|uniref:hypothetical protein n=1 Tax=Aquibacillus saliphilus TaxID=1909422 RepID=UPI001CF0A48E|nr:hypothetical protein [Aquibacillus saliphilus]
MYSLEEVIKLLKEDQTAICVYGELKGEELFWSEGELHSVDEDGVGGAVPIRKSDFYKYRDTEWIIESD